MVAAAYAVEAIGWGICTLVYLVLFGALVLACRFTPRKKLNDAKLTILALASLSVLVDIPRTLDLSSVYERIGFTSAAWLHCVVTSLHLFAAAVFIRSIARALYLQIQAPVPRLYGVMLGGATGFYLVAIFVLNPIHLATTGDAATSRMIAIKGLCFDISIFFIVVMQLVLFVRLYWRLKKFVKTVESQYKPASNQVASPSNAGVVRSQLARETANESPVTHDEGGATSPPELLRQKSTDLIPARLLASPSSAAVHPVPLSPRGDSDEVMIIKSPIVPKLDFCILEKKGLLTVNVHTRQSSDDAASTVGPISPANNPMSPSVATTLNGTRVSPFSVQTRTIPSRTAVASPPPAPAVFVQRSHEQRVEELRRAVRTLTILNFAVVILGSVCIIFDMISSLPMILGTIPSHTKLYGPDPEHYELMHNAMPFVQQVNLAVMVYYTWTPWLWLAKYRNEKRIGFFDGLRFGPEGGERTVVGSRAEASQLTVVQSNTKTTVKDGPSVAVSPAIQSMAAQTVPSIPLIAWGRQLSLQQNSTVPEEHEHEVSPSQTPR